MLHNNTEICVVAITQVIVADSGLFVGLAKVLENEEHELYGDITVLWIHT